MNSLMDNLTPRQIVEELDKFIIGQHAAKRAVAIAVRNRWRRRQLAEELRREVYPSNLIMIGPTGVGKTEIARRLAHLVNAPFIKVEATKYTEVGYHGRDVESIVRDLLDQSIRMVQAEQTETVRTEAERLAKEALIDALMPASDHTPGSPDEIQAQKERRRRSREKLGGQLDAGELEEGMVDLEMEVKAQPVGLLASFGPIDQMEPELQNFLDRLMPSQNKRKRVKVKDARRILFQQQSERLIDREKLVATAIDRTENSGIVFIDEIDKIASRGDQHAGPDVSRHGVQRDLLPIIEGCAVNTRHGVVRTDHVLFITAGAFSSTKPSDLMPELQGRLPIRVQLDDLTKEDFLRILTEPENALTKQQVALMGVENVTIEFEPEALARLAETAYELNQSVENIGARRLMTVMERLMDEISFDAPQRRNQRIRITPALVTEKLGPLNAEDSLQRFIL